MRAARLEVRDFRSYHHQTLELSPDLNVFVGRNGAGKTNLLEALHLGLQGFTLRSRRDVTAVRFGADAARVDTSGTRGSGVSFTTTVVISRPNGKRVTIDGAHPEGLDDLRGAFPVLAFTPDRLAVVKGGPIVRRTYLDRMVGRVLPARADVPSDYASALAQRNAGLRRVGSGYSSRDAITPWTEAVARLGAELDRLRLEVLAELEPRFGRHAGRLGLPEARMEYSAADITAERLESQLARDLERGTTGLGPHLADLDILAGTRDLRSFGSQGEQRSAVLALLLAEAELLLELRDDPPLLLLDDVLSELDEGRRELLLTGLPEGCQTVLTSTSLRSLPKGAAERALVVDVRPGEATRR